MRRIPNGLRKISKEELIAKLSPNSSTALDDQERSKEKQNTASWEFLSEEKASNLAIRW
jgi:hypothetical protein